MAFLEIVHINGESEKRNLSKQVPLTIGSHASADLTIDESDVEVLHCRITWIKNHFEAVAIGTAALEVNGTKVTQIKLKDGDVLRFGSVDVTYLLDADDDFAADEDDGLTLKPLTEEFSLEEDEEEPQPKSNRPKAIPTGGLEGLSAGLAALAAESQADIPTEEKPKKKSKSSKSENRSSRTSSDKAKDNRTSASPAKPDSPTPPDPDSSRPPQRDEPSERLRSAIRAGRQRRPGEEDPLTSPLVLGLTGGAFALILAAAIFYFIGFRQTTQQEFDLAKSIYDEGKFQNAINAFNDFLLIHKDDPLAEQAKELLGLARVRQQIESATPNFPEGLDQLRGFIRENSGREADFEALHPTIATHAQRIALGSAELAGKTFDESLLQTSQEAKTVLTTYTPKDTPPVEALKQILDASRASEAAILKNTVYKDHISRMAAALEGDAAKTSPLTALKVRRDLLVRYKNLFEKDKQVVSLFDKALKTEATKVIQTEINQDAIVTDREIVSEPLTVAFHNNTNLDQVSVGRAVIALAKDCCYGIDFVTGEPIWRRAIGFGTPFFPIQESNLPSAIIFDTNHQELVRLHQATGQLIWRQPLGSDVIARPLLVDNTLYLATSAGELLSVALESGQLLSKLTFSQPISGAVILNDDEHLLVAGSEEVLYTISQRPFECVQTSYLGQAAGSVEAPLLPMGPYLLLIENLTDSAKLHLLLADSASQPITSTASSTISGRVIDDPVIRGRDLFVPATGDRIYSFNVSDDPGQPPLTPGPVFEGPGTNSSSLSLLTGPNGEVWMATDALHKLQLTTDSLQPDGAPIAPGIGTQPLQSVAGYLLNARSRPYTSAVTFTRTNREDRTSDWQVVLGGSVLASTVRDQAGVNITVVNEAGHSFRISDRQLAGERFFSDATVRLPVHADLKTPLLAAEVSRNRIAVAGGDPEPRLWVINAAGQIEGSPLINKPVQAPPCPLGDRIVLPVAGALEFARFSGQSQVRGFELPTGEEQTWLSVVPVGDEKIAAVTTSGTILLLQIQPTPSPHLAEIARIELGAKILFPPSANSEVIAVVDASQKLSILETSRLDPQTSRQFDTPITAGPIVTGTHVLISENQLHCLNLQDLADIVVVPANGAALTGGIEANSKVLVTMTNGNVAVIDPDKKEVTATQELDAALKNPPFAAGGKFYVFAVDGTLYRLPDPS